MYMKEKCCDKCTCGPHCLTEECKCECGCENCNCCAEGSSCC